MVLTSQSKYTVPRPDSKRRSAPPRRQETRFPLDPAHLLQRALDSGSPADLPVLRINSPTRSSTLFRKRIGEVDPRAKHGDLVKVVTGGDALVGYGLWNPRAEAAVRLLTTEAPPDSGWWTARLESAVQLRRDVLKLDAATNAYRLVNAEGDGLPGMVADRYDDVLALEIFSLGMYQRGEAIARRLAELAGLAHWVVRPGPSTLEQEGFAAEGFASPGAPEKVQIREHGVRYELSPAAGHKTGFFCDQRENRLRLREFCRGKSVLDLCCYTGGFALNALQAGAAEVTSVDLDEEAIRLARRNAQLNKGSIKFVHADAFAYMRDMQRNGRTYDVLILDPPKLIRGRDEAAEGQSKYFDLNKLAASLVAPGGLLLTCSCSGLLSMEQFTMTVRAATSERRPQLLARTGAALDHPISLGQLETEYLKCLWLRMEC